MLSKYGTFYRPGSFLVNRLCTDSTLRVSFIKCGDQTDEFPLTKGEHRFWRPSAIYLYHGTESTCVLTTLHTKPCSLFYRWAENVNAESMRMPRSLTNVGAGNTVSSRLNTISAVVVFNRRRPTVRCWHLLMDMGLSCHVLLQTDSILRFCLNRNWSQCGVNRN